MKVSEKGIALIARFEGFRAEAYQDVVGVWTVGFGETWLRALGLLRDSGERCALLANYRNRF